MKGLSMTSINLEVKILESGHVIFYSDVNTVCNCQSICVRIEAELLLVQSGQTHLLGKGTEWPLLRNNISTQQATLSRKIEIPDNSC